MSQSRSSLKTTYRDPLLEEIRAFTSRIAIRAIRAPMARAAAAGRRVRRARDASRDATCSADHLNRARGAGGCGVWGVLCTQLSQWESPKKAYGALASCAHQWRSDPRSCGSCCGDAPTHTQEFSDCHVVLAETSTSSQTCNSKPWSARNMHLHGIGLALSASRVAGNGQSATFVIRTTDRVARTICMSSPM